MGDPRLSNGFTTTEQKTQWSTTRRNVPTTRLKLHFNLSKPTQVEMSLSIDINKDTSAHRLNEREDEQTLESWNGRGPSTDTETGEPEGRLREETTSRASQTNNVNHKHHQIKVSTQKHRQQHRHRFFTFLSVLHHPIEPTQYEQSGRWPSL